MKRIIDANLETIDIRQEIITTMFGESGLVYVCLMRAREGRARSSPLFFWGSDGRCGKREDKRK
jgi:hypothetical protein